MRISLLGKKLGMSQIKEGNSTIPVTVIQILDYDVFGIKTIEKHGYNAVVLSAGEEQKESKITKPLLTQFKNAQLTPRKNIFEVRVESSQSIKSAEKTDEDVFAQLEGSFVDVTGETIGKGFAGVMKRWNFAGLEASHGVSVSHRSHGSTGQRQDPGRVFKGKKMAGHMGAKQRTVQNLRIVQADKDLKIIAVYGAVPGSENSLVFVNNASKMGKTNAFTKLNNINLVF